MMPSKAIKTHAEVQGRKKKISAALNTFFFTFKTQKSLFWQLKHLFFTSAGLTRGNNLKKNIP